MLYENIVCTMLRYFYRRYIKLMDTLRKDDPIVDDGTYDRNVSEDEAKYDEEETNDNAVDDYD